MVNLFWSHNGDYLFVIGEREKERKRENERERERGREEIYREKGGHRDREKDGERGGIEKQNMFETTKMS